MKKRFFPVMLFLIAVWLGQSCGPTPSEEEVDSSSESTLPVVAVYHGNLPSSEYDSIVNHLVMYENETFDLNQVDRIAEHHLNEKDHNGIYVYLADSTRLGLYSDDGYLMLQFLLTERGMKPMIVNTDQVISDRIEWKRK